MQRQIAAARLPTPETEFRFAAGRRWRFDFAWPGAQVALEIEGGTWSGGRHVRGAGFAADAAKYAEATIAGWRVIRVTSSQVRRGDALGWLKRALERFSVDQATI
jgi:very-short-patch-repair endonuclease